MTLLASKVRRARPLGKLSPRSVLAAGVLGVIVLSGAIAAAR